MIFPIWESGRLKVQKNITDNLHMVNFFLNPGEIKMEIGIEDRNDF